MKILVIEDDVKVAAFIKKGLSEEQYAVEVCHDGAEGASWAEGADYDAIILDVMLPGMDGLAVCRRLRERRVQTPILMLTARDAVADRVLGLDVGADDYLGKPFAFSEILARLRALFRRSQAALPPVLRVADLEVDPTTRVVTRAGRRISLTGKEYALLEYMVRNKGRVLTETRILEHVWNIDHDPATNVVNVYLYHLRRKVDRDFTPKLLHTVRGVGFVLDDDAP